MSTPLSGSTSCPTASNSAPLAGLAQKLELVRNFVTEPGGVFSVAPLLGISAENDPVKSDLTSNVKVISSVPDRIEPVPLNSVGGGGVPHAWIFGPNASWSVHPATNSSSAAAIPPMHLRPTRGPI